MSSTSSTPHYVLSIIENAINYLNIAEKHLVNTILEFVKFGNSDAQIAMEQSHKSHFEFFRVCMSLRYDMFKAVADFINTSPKLEQIDGERISEKLRKLTPRRILIETKEIEPDPASPSSSSSSNLPPPPSFPRPSSLSASFSPPNSPNTSSALPRTTSTPTTSSIHSPKFIKQPSMLIKQEKTDHHCREDDRYPKLYGPGNYTLAHMDNNLSLQQYCILDMEKDPDLIYVRRSIFGKMKPEEDRALGCFLGLAVADAMGAQVEFQPYINPYDKKKKTLETLEDMGDEKVPHGKFRLLPGQWTDDTAMALCLADSLLLSGILDPGDNMLRYLNWWHHGYNNAFAHDEKRQNKRSVGLGGNILKSFEEYRKAKDPLTKAGDNQTNGNGSIMRLAPVAIFFHSNEQEAMTNSRISSLVTHQGDEASSCCRLLAFIIVRAMHYSGNSRPDPQKVLTACLSDFKDSNIGVMALASSKQEGNDSNRNWNWKDESYHYPTLRVEAAPGYVGSYCMDAMAMALHCVWTTKSFRQSVLKAVNMRGDADSVGAVTGQIAGAIYGISDIPKTWILSVDRWTLPPNKRERFTREKLSEDVQDFRDIPGGIGTITARAYKLFRYRLVMVE